MIKLRDILMEVTAPKPEDAYPLSGPITSTSRTLQIYKYRFKNRKGDDMTVEANFDTADDNMFVVFYKSSQENTDSEEEKYKEETGSRDMLRVLATVVEAVRRTAERIGGMQRIMRIQLEPADPRRFNIYSHYAKTLFPEFSVREVGRWIWLTNRNYKREEHTLQEIGDAGAKVYGDLKPTEHYIGDPTMYRYDFTTESGTPYIVRAIKYDATEEDPTTSFVVAFEVKGKDFDEETNKGELYRIMATVVGFVKGVIESDPTSKDDTQKTIVFVPSKRDPKNNRRLHLYTAYVKRQIPGSEIEGPTDGGMYTVYLPKK